MLDVVMDDSVYNKCFLNSSSCGPYNFRYESGIFKLNDLNAEIRYGSSLVKESTLIMSRISEKPDNDSVICAHHRYTLGSLWRSPNRCMHPLHSEVGVKRSKKKTSLRPASLDNSHLIAAKFPDGSFPMFGNLCSKHRSTEVTPDEDLQDKEIHDPTIEMNFNDSKISLNSFVENSTDELFRKHLL